MERRGRQLHRRLGDDATSAGNANEARRRPAAAAQPAAGISQLTPHAARADRGYWAAGIRQGLSDRQIEPMISRRRNPGRGDPARHPDPHHQPRPPGNGSNQPTRSAATAGKSKATNAWLHGFRRVHIRRDEKLANYHAFMLDTSSRPGGDLEFSSSPRTRQSGPEARSAGAVARASTGRGGPRRSATSRAFSAAQLEPVAGRQVAARRRRSGGSAGSGGGMPARRRPPARRRLERRQRLQQPAVQLRRARGQMKQLHAARVLERQHQQLE